MFREPRTEDTRALLQAVLRNPFAAELLAADEPSAAYGRNQK
jgi:hypothetical protein